MAKQKKAAWATGRWFRVSFKESNTRGHDLFYHRGDIAWCRLERRGGDDIWVVLKGGRYWELRTGLAREILLSESRDGGKWWADTEREDYLSRALAATRYRYKDRLHSQQRW